MKSKLEKELLETTWKDPGNWRGPFYFNRKDYRILVPKLSPSLGRTLNFANPYSFLVMGTIIIAILVVGLFA